MFRNQEVGKLGEDIGVKYLKNKGCKILDRNFEKHVGSMKLGEIDIVARKDKVIIFCEVKTLSSEKGLSPEQRVDAKKKETIIKIAEIWLDEHKISLNSQWQIDVLAIVLNFNFHKAKIKHFENI
jgi:putative endonuclease